MSSSTLPTHGALTFNARGKKHSVFCPGYLHLWLSMAFDNMHASPRVGAGFWLGVYELFEASGLSVTSTKVRDPYEVQF